MSTYNRLDLESLGSSVTTYSPPLINVTLINVNSLYLLQNRTPLILLTIMLTMLTVNNN